MEWENHASENLQTSIERRHDVPDMVDEFVYSSCVSEEWTSRPPSQLGRHSVHFPLLQPMTSVIKYIVFVVVTFRFRRGGGRVGVGGLLRNEFKRVESQ